MSSKEMLEFMNQYADSFLEDTRTNGDATEYHANSLKYFGMKMLINAVGKEMSIGGNEDNAEDEEFKNDNFFPMETGEIERYGVNVCSFRYRHHAEELRDELIKEQNYAAFIEEADGFYRVRIGYFKDKEMVSQLVNQLICAGYEGAHVCVDGNDTKEEKISNCSEKVKDKAKIKNVKENLGEIALGENVYFADPAIKVAGKERYSRIGDVLPGTYHCTLNKVGVTGDDGKFAFSSDSLEIRHIDYDNIPMKEKEKVFVNIFSTMAGIFNSEAIRQFIELSMDKPLTREKVYNEWYQRVGDATMRQVENPDYVSFEYSKFWSDEFLELQQEEYSQDVYLKYLDAKMQYDKLEMKEQVTDFEAGGTIDGTGAVFANMYMTDKEIVCVVERNEDGKVIGFKIKTNDFESPVFNFNK